MWPSGALTGPLALGVERLLGSPSSIWDLAVRSLRGARRVVLPTGRRRLRLPRNQGQMQPIGRTSLALLLDRLGNWHAFGFLDDCDQRIVRRPNLLECNPGRQTDRVPLTHPRFDPFPENGVDRRMECVDTQPQKVLGAKCRVEPELELFQAFGPLFHPSEKVLHAPMVCRRRPLFGDVCGALGPALHLENIV